MNSYALCVERYKENDYIWPMNIEQIDEIFTTYSKSEVLRMMREADSVLQETNPDNLKIKKRIKDKYVEEKFTPIITDSFYLTYPLDNLPLDMAKNDSLARILYNHLLPIQKRANTKEIYTKLLEALRENKQLFISEFNNSPYIVQRTIRSIIAYKFDVFEYLSQNKNLSLQKTSEKAA